MQKLLLFCCYQTNVSLVHLSRLTSELVVYAGIRRRHQLFQTTLILKPCIFHIWERIMFFFCPNQIRTLVAANLVVIELQWGKQWKLAFTAFSLQIFWQKFHRNVPWVVLYKTYLLASNLVVTTATKMQNLWKKYLKINSSETVWGIKQKHFRIVTNNSLYKNIFFIAVARALWLLWQLSFDLQWEKWK